MECDVVDRHPLAAFTLVAYAFSWAAWTAQASLPETSALRTALFVLGVLGPFAAGLVLTAVRGDRVRPWLGDVFAVRVPARYYLHAGANAVVNYYPVGGAAGALSPPGHALLVAVIVAAAVAVVALAGSRLGRTPATT